MKSSVIVFRLLPEHGHHNATFFFGKQLVEQGHRVLYAASENLKDHITANGFEFYEVPFGDDSAHSGKFKNKWKLLFIGLRNRRLLVQNRKIAGLILRNHNYLKRIHADLNPDLIIVDRAYGPLALNALELNIKVCQIETTVSTARTRGLPPLGSYWIPSHSLFSDLLCSWQWFAIFLERKLNAWIYGSLKESLFSLAKKASYPINKIDPDRYHNEGYDSIKELIVSPQEFDFPHTPKSNQVYIGPPLIINRNDSAVENFINPFRNEAKPLIYCAMGSLSWRYMGIEKFYKTLFEVFKKRPEYNFIVSISDDGLRKKLDNERLPHARTFKHVPQLKILNDVSVMINHGGLNSITECILLSVPMLIYPGTNQLDQPGNSSRVIYHGIGLRGKLGRESVRKMAHKIDRLVNDPVYRQNIIALRKKIQEQKNYLNGPKVIESIINPSYELIVNEK